MATENKFPLVLESDRYTLELTLEQDATQCLASLTHHSDPPLNKNELLDILAAREVTYGIDFAAIERLCLEAASGREQERVLIARGVEPESLDGRIEFTAQPSLDKPELRVDAKANQADYRITNMFENVYKDQTIALLHKASKQNGMTVTERVLEARPGHEIYVQAGDGVKKVDNGRRMIATRDGRVVHMGDKVSVSDQLVVDFDVDFHVGHIDFVGFIRVGGDVLDGFNVSGKKGIQIDGTVGVCRISSEGNIKLGGMAGGKRSEAQIHCGGELTANYLHGVHIDCAGDIHVSYEMLHCQANTRGALYIHGNVSGGEYAAANGIELETAGSELGVVTRLSAGIEEKNISPMARLEDELGTINREMQRIIKQLDPLRRNPGAIANSDRLKKLAADLLAEYQRLNARKQELDSEVQSVRYEELRRAQDIKERANSKINVIRKLYHGTIITLDGKVQKFRNDATGPISIIACSSSDGLRVLPMTALTTNARDLEKNLLNKESR